MKPDEMDKVANAFEIAMNTLANIVKYGCPKDSDLARQIIIEINKVLE